MTHALAAPLSVADAVRRSCRMEIEAFKPGNVSVYSAGHGMTADDFLKSADLIAPILGSAGLTIGEKILESVQATMEQIGTNTNLGIILLCAPLTTAAISLRNGDLRGHLRQILRQLTVHDATLTTQAIQRANPAGLGHVQRHDVNDTPTVDLLALMTEARHRDRIACQYATDYNDIFQLGLKRLTQPNGHWEKAEQTIQWTTVSCYLGFLSAFPDSHIERKHGAYVATQIQKSAKILETKFKACENPPAAVPLLRDYDNQLKEEGINPGTSADLTVASLLVWHLEALIAAA